MLALMLFLRRPIKIHRAAKGETFIDPMLRRE
jgi:hypothetical protein